MRYITTVPELEALYGQPQPTSTVKEVDRITPFLHKLAIANPLEIADLNLKRFLKRTDLLPPAPDAAAGEP